MDPDDIIQIPGGPAIPRAWLDTVDEMAALYDIPREILLSQITQESGWNPEARSSAGALGLTQVMPKTAQELRPGLSEEGLASLMQDPMEQIRLGAEYLGRLRDRFGGAWPEALGVYNSGPGTVEDPRAGTKDDPHVRYFDETGQRQWVYDTPETQNYLLDIMERARTGGDELFIRRASPDRTPRGATFADRGAVLCCPGRAVRVRRRRLLRHSAPDAPVCGGWLLSIHHALREQASPLQERVRATEGAWRACGPHGAAACAPEV